MRRIICAWVLLGGCYRSHERLPDEEDAGPRPKDAAPIEDAAPDAGVDAGPPTLEVEWETSVAYSTSDVYVAESDVAVDAEGASVVAWIAYDLFGALISYWLEVARVGPDGVVTDSPAEVPGGREYDFDPTLCTTPDGVFVLAAGCYDLPSAGVYDSHLCVSRSTDGGRTFGPYVEIDPPLDPPPTSVLYDRPWVACGSDGSVALTYTRFDGYDGTSADAGVPFLTVSLDGGVTWQSHVELDLGDAAFYNLNVASTSVDSTIVVSSDDYDSIRVSSIDAFTWPPTVSVEGPFSWIERLPAAARS
ncbi:MAG: glycoside hydrolase, partial [Actinobacteria bacterium]|nr:glycoside hydrolase [Actinomycetota bacterium]